MLRQIHFAPRLTVNAAAATSTDTVHRVRLDPNVDPATLAAVFHNSATFAFAEIMGRSYGAASWSWSLGSRATTYATAGVRERRTCPGC